MSPMPPAVRTAFEAELATARTATEADDRWRALERAHILSHAWAWPHTRAHWHMFRLALEHRDRGEMLGQIIRLAIAGPGSLMGRAPLGNTGRTSIGLWTRLPIPQDLAEILEKTSGPARSD